MKTLLKAILCVSVTLVMFTGQLSAQGAKSFKGSVVYTLTYTGNIDAATLAQQPKMITVSILDHKQKMNMSLGPVSIDVISDGDKKESITLIDMMGQKKYYKTAQAEIESEMAEAGAPEIKYSDETKTVAGYTCKKAEYTTKDKEGETNVTVIYYTEDLGSEALNYGTNFQGLKGFPLEYVITQKDIVTTFAATEVKKGKVKDTDFMIPSDYIELTAEEKAQMKAAFKGE
jgi:GLPGLI family protein